MSRLLPTPQLSRPLRFQPLVTTKAVVPTPVREPVSETEYWDKYYNDPDHHYEWNNGSLEEKGVSEKLTLFSYEWFFELLRHYLRITQTGQLIALETAFRLALPGKTAIRKPDLGVILNSNPVPWRDSDHSFRGICDLCVEALSDSSTENIERDTVSKFTEYAQGGVPEYYILYAYGEPQEFYHLTPPGVYVPIPRVDGDVICSTALPGFQFRVSDLQRQPSPEEMSEDNIYQAFMLPALQAEKQGRQWVTQLYEQAQEAWQVADAQAQQEREVRLQEQQVRQAAEAQVQQERELRQVAEAQAQQEREVRLQAQQAQQAAEAKLQQLEAELARFRLPPEKSTT
jgi:hypothetical protein